jgi:hypothetical protein
MVRVLALTGFFLCIIGREGKVSYSNCDVSLKWLAIRLSWQGLFSCELLANTDDGL